MIYFRSYVSHLTIAGRMISHLSCPNIPLFSHLMNRPVFTNILIHITGGIHFSAAACTVNISGQQGLTFGVLRNMLFLLIITGALF